jgi:hypothetical protein
MSAALTEGDVGQYTREVRVQKRRRVTPARLTANTAVAARLPNGFTEKVGDVNRVCG